MTLTDIKDRVVAAAGAQSERYSHGDDRPLRGYAITMTVYASLVGALASIARFTGRDVPDGFPVTDVALCAAATYKLSRLLAKDAVTSPLRAPFTSYQGTRGPAGRDARVYVDQLVDSGEGQHPGHGRRAGSQPQPRAVRRGPLDHADQGRDPGRVAERRRGHVRDHPSGTLRHGRQQVLAHQFGVGHVDLGREGNDRDAADPDRLTLPRHGPSPPVGGRRGLGRVSGPGKRLP